MDLNAPPPELNAIKNRTSLATLWPQVVTGISALAATIWAFIEPSGASVAMAIGAAALFLITVAYLLLMLRDNFGAMRLLTWGGGFFLAVYFMSLSHALVPISLLFIVQVASYSLSTSDRPTMRRGLLCGFLLIVVLGVVSELRRRGILPEWIAMPPNAVSVIFIVLTLGLSADVLQRFMRLFDRIEASVYRVQRSNAELQKTRAELEQRLHERTRLLDVTRTVASTLDLQTLLDSTLSELRTLIHCDNADIFLLTNTDMPAVASHGSPHSAGSHSVVLLSARPVFARVINSRAPVVVPDCSIAPSGDLPQPDGAWMGIPLIVRGESIGLLSLSSAARERFNEHSTALALAFANQVSGLIHNARLRNEAAQTAALAERNRLARDLHDSVTQSLFGIGLGIRTVEQEMLHSHDRANHALEYTRQLADNAMTEMRALIFTLRPESLINEGIVAAINKHIESLKIRFSIPITLAQSGTEPDLTPEAKEALYRITLEAVQNALKHAQPRAIHIDFECDPNWVAINVRDEGRGFDPTLTYAGRLGLQSMRERAQDLGGTTTITSAPDIGTTVRTVIPAHYI